MSLLKYKQSGHIGLFDKEETGSKLSKLGNPLEKLHKVIDFEIFRIELEDNILKHDRKSNAGCKPYDVVMMFKIILLKRFYNMSDEQAEYQINDRLSFRLVNRRPCTGCPFYLAISRHIDTKEFGNNSI